MVFQYISDFTTPSDALCTRKVFISFLVDRHMDEIFENNKVLISELSKRNAFLASFLTRYRKSQCLHAKRVV